MYKQLYERRFAMKEPALAGPSIMDLAAIGCAIAVIVILGLAYVPGILEPFRQIAAALRQALDGLR